MKNLIHEVIKSLGGIPQIVLVRNSDDVQGLIVPKRLPVAR